MYRIAVCAALCGATAFTLLASCSNIRDAMDEASAEPGPESVAFRCDDDRSFLAMVSEDRDQAFVETGDDTYELALVDRDGDRLAYTNRDDVNLIVEEDEAYLRVPGESDFKDCRATT
jgi:hypothetical protein